jgi:hypothetical protein
MTLLMTILRYVSGGLEWLFIVKTATSCDLSIQPVSITLGQTMHFMHVLFSVVAGTQPGGWMQRLKNDGVDPTKPLFSEISPTSKSPQPVEQPLVEVPMTKPTINRKITADELEVHQREGDPWFAVKGEVRPTHVTCVLYLRVLPLYPLSRFTMAQVF